MNAPQGGDDAFWRPQVPERLMQFERPRKAAELTFERETEDGIDRGDLDSTHAILSATGKLAATHLPPPSEKTNLVLIDGRESTDDEQVCETSWVL